MRLLWLEVVERQGDNAAIHFFLSGNLSFLRPASGTRDLMAFAQALSRHGFTERARDLGYKVLRDRWSNAKAHLGFFGLMLMSEKIQSAIQSPASIGPGVAFTVEDHLGHRRVFVVEEEAEPKIELNEIAVESRLAKAAFGLKVGESVKVNDNDLTSAEAIVEISHKYLGLLHRSLREFNTLFPDNNSLIGINLDEANPERFLEQIAPIMAARKAAQRDMLERYKKGPLPIAFAGQSIGLGPIEAWETICQAEVAVDVCAGTKEERDGAAALLKERPQLILDPLTFWIAGTLNLLDAFTITFGQLGLTETSIELLTERKRFASERLVRGTGVIVERDEKINFLVERI
jgi:transcription elongation GreA/GreB family factor